MKLLEYVIQLFSGRLIQLDTIEETWRALEKFGRIQESPEINHDLKKSLGVPRNPQDSSVNPQES